MVGHPLDYDDGVPSVNPIGGTSARERIDVSPDMFGAGIGHALGGFGQAVEKVSDQGFSVLDDQSKLQDHTHASEVHSWQSDKSTDVEAGFMSLTGRDAIDALPAYKAQLEDIHQQARAQAGNPYTAQLIDTDGRALIDRSYNAAARHAAAEEKTWQTKTADLSAQSHGSRAVLAATQSKVPDVASDQDVQRELFNSDAQKQALAELSSYGPDAIEQVKQQNRGQNVKAIVEQLAKDGSPTGVDRASKFFEAEKGRIDAGSRTTISNFLAGPRDQIAGQAIGDQVLRRPPTATPPEVVADVPANFISAIKQTEGFTARATPDFKQESSGFGTKALYPGEVIDVPTANARFNSEITKAAKFVDSIAPHLDAGTRAALTSLTFNAGQDWASSGLGAKIKAGDLAGAKELFLQYNKAGGETNDGLVQRRAREASWFGRGDLSPAEISAPRENKGTVMLRIIDDPALQNQPQVQAAALARVNKIYQAWDLQQAQSTATFDLTVKNSTTEALLTGNVQHPLGREQFLMNYGGADGEKAFADYQANVQLGSDIRSTASLDPQALSTLRAKYQPQPGDNFIDQAKRAAALDKAIAANEKAKADDPADFLIKHTDFGKQNFDQFNELISDKNATPGMKQAYAGMFATKMFNEQARLGIPPEERVVMPDWSAKPIRDQISAAASSDDPKARQGVINTINAQKQLWGDRWPQVVPQLAPAGAAPLVKAIAAGADPIAMQRLLAVDPKENPAKILKEQNETQARNMQTAVNVAFAPFLGSMVGAQKDRDFAGYRDLGEKLAALYVRDGDDASTAAQKAFNNLVGDRYVFRDTYRVPKDPHVDPDAVQRGTQEARDMIVNGKASDVANPFARIEPQINDMGITDNESDSRRNYARDGVFVTSARNDGLNIAYKNAFVAGADGRPVLLTWSQLGAMGASNRARTSDVFTRRGDEVMP